MKTAIVTIACIACFGAQALECEKYVDNDQVCISKVTLSPKEEVGPHHDPHHQVLIGLKNGMLNQISSDGKVSELYFVEGMPVFKDRDEANQYHRMANRSEDSMEVLVIEMKNDSLFERKKGDHSHDFSVNIRMNCPMSKELKNFIRAIPPSGNYSSNFDEWKSMFVDNMSQLVHLVQNEKIYNAFWSIRTDDAGWREANKQ